MNLKLKKQNTKKATTTDGISALINNQCHCLTKIYLILVEFTYT